METADPPQCEVTALLHQWQRGDASALDRLTPLIYRELRRLAASYPRRERSGHTLQATALVHEAYLRLAEVEKPTNESRQPQVSAAYARKLSPWISVRTLMCDSERHLIIERNLLPHWMRTTVVFPL